VGRTQEDGTFTLTTGTQEGAPAGAYRVTIIWPQPVAPQAGKAAMSTARPDTEDRLQGAYANPAQSKFKVEIKPGANQLEPFCLQ
jgi:hypothetical protein